MLTIQDKQRLLEMLPDFLLMSDASDAAALKEAGAVEATTAEEVVAAYDILENRRSIFHFPTENENLVPLLNKCRIVANSMADLVAINEASAARGVITMVGLRLKAEGFEADAMTTDELRGLVHDMKQLKNVSVCGCIVAGNVEGLHGNALGKYIRSSYVTAKAMTYILPCTMPYIVISGCLDAIARNETEHPEDFQEFLTAANIVGMQNATAFYADYYIQ